MYLAKKLRALRVDNGISQATLAYDLGITRTNLSAWERGLHRPSAAFLVKYTSIFNISIMYFVKDYPSLLTELEDEQTEQDPEAEPENINTGGE